MGTSLNVQIAVDDCSVGRQLGGCARPDDLAADQHDVAVGEGEHGVDVFVDQQDGLAVLFECRQTFPYFGTNKGREALGGFVKDQQMWVGHQRTPDGEHLLFSAR